MTSGAMAGCRLGSNPSRRTDGTRPPASTGSALVSPKPTVECGGMSVLPRTLASSAAVVETARSRSLSVALLLVTVKRMLAPALS